MTKILNFIHNANQKFDNAAEHLLIHHPLLGYLTVFIGAPILIPVAVFVCTIIIALPMAWICGWL